MFRSQPGSNRGRGVTGPDESAELFAPGYSFGEPIQPIENDPGYVADPVAPSQGEPADNWFAEPPASEPTTAALTRQPGADSAWKFWSSANATIPLALPDGSDIRSVWLPVLPTPVQFFLAYAQGSLMYEATYAGGELVPIPKGTKTITLSVANSTIIKPDIWVFITHDPFPPFKMSGGAPLAPASDAYDQGILGTPGLFGYWPFSDPKGSLTVANLFNPAQPGSVLGNATLGNAALLVDNETSGLATTGSNDGFSLPIDSQQSSGGAHFSVEFWFRAQSVPNLTSGEGVTLYTQAGGSPAHFGWYSPSGTGTYFAYGYGPSSAPWESSGELADTALHYVVISYDGTNYNLYIDGVLKVTNTADPSGSPTAPDIISAVGIGAYVEKLAFYDVALPAGTITNHYEAGL